MDQNGIEWAAGLFEGEGCISFHKIKTRKNSFHFSLSLQMSDEDVVQKFHTVVGKGNFLGPYSGQRDGHKKRWLWQIQNQKGCCEVLEMLLPYFGIRRYSKALEFLKAVEERHSV